jgi:hypothetical protein
VPGLFHIQVDIRSATMLGMVFREVQIKSNMLSFTQLRKMHAHCTASNSVALVTRLGVVSRPFFDLSTSDALLHRGAALLAASH